MGLIDELDGAEPDGLTRRTVLKRGGLLVVALSIPAAGTGHIGPSAATAATAHTAAAGPPLTAAQTSTLDAIIERLVPADATGPGGVEMGASAFIQQSLASRALSPLKPVYSSGLDAVNGYAQGVYGAGFAALSPDQQDAVLTDMSSGKASGFSDPGSAAFFATVHEHTLEGMFSDPVYGGNKNFAGWDLIGYPGVRMPVPAADQRIGVAIKAAHKSTYANGQYAEAKKESLA